MMLERVPALRLENLSVGYLSSDHEWISAITDLSLTLCLHDFLCIIGQSGSGKSTLLKVIAGQLSSSGGTLYKASELDRIGMVFQDNSLFPFFTVESNLTYSLRIRGVPKKQRHVEAVEMCNLLGLNPAVYLKRYPLELSGGERRRVALGMALIHDARLLLLDEPTTGLDDLNKWRFQELLQSAWLRKPFTCVAVTHDIEEAIYLGDCVMGLSRGRQSGTVHVDITRPRSSEFRYSSNFNGFRKQVSKLYESRPDYRLEGLS
jgi:NitT/TauT family transport system ATP-binding protein